MLRAFYLPSHTRREALEAPDNQLPHAALLRGCGRRKLGEDESTADDAYWGSNGQGNVMHHVRGCGGESTALGGELTHLTLSGLRMGAEDAKAVAKVLRGNSTLQSLE